MGVRTSNPENRNSTPSGLALIADKLLNDFEKLFNHLRNSAQGCMVIDPTTASAQLTGIGNTTWSYDIVAGIVVVGGVALDVGEGADQAIHSGSFLTGLASGSSCVAAIVAKNVAGTVSIVAVKGTPAVTGSQVAPTDAEITAAVVAGNDWVKLAECTINRTADTTVTESQDNSKRPLLGINVDTNIGSYDGVTIR